MATITIRKTYQQWWQEEVPKIKQILIKAGIPVAEAYLSDRERELWALGDGGWFGLSYKTFAGVELGHPVKVNIETSDEKLYPQLLKAAESLKEQGYSVNITTDFDDC